MAQSQLPVLSMPLWRALHVQADPAEELVVATT
jgi:hypothetical protein